PSSDANHALPRERPVVAATIAALASRAVMAARWPGDAAYAGPATDSSPGPANSTTRASAPARANRAIGLRPRARRVAISWAWYEARAPCRPPARDGMPTAV